VIIHNRLYYNFSTKISRENTIFVKISDLIQNSSDDVKEYSTVAHR